MLRQIRSAADNVIFRIVLGVLVVAFGFWGVDDVLNSRNNLDVVTFNNADAISEAEFLRAKSKEISQIQQSQGVNLSEEQIKQYGINEMVIDKLISGRLIDQLVKAYDLDIGDKSLANFIKQLPYFKNKKDEFDLEAFKSYLRHSGITEEEYSAELKSKLLRNLLLGSFMRSSYLSQTSVQNMAIFWSEEREFDLVSIDLASTKYVKVGEPTPQQLEEFYKDNLDSFTLPEKRDLSYVILDGASIAKGTKVSESEVKQFFDENKEEFGTKTFAKVKTDIEAMLKTRKSEELFADLAKNLDDEVAGGASLAEIAQKFNLKLLSLSNVTTESLVANKTIGALVDNIFGMQSGEVSYPLELPDPKTLALVEIKKVTSATPLELDKIKSDVALQWKKSQYFDLNMKILQDFASQTKPENFKTEAAKLSLDATEVKLKRSELETNNKFPPEMLIRIFSMPPGLISSLFSNEDKAFIALVRKAKHNNEAAKLIIKNSGERISEQLRNGLIQEIMTSLKNKEDVKINSKDKVLEQ